MMARALPPVAFNFPELVATFSEICPDFNDDDPCGKSESLGFAAKVLFELGPQMHKLKKSGKDETWCIELQSSCNVYVYTHRFSRPTNVQPKIRDSKLYLTLKQASLLATAKLCRILSPDLKPTDKLLLTPMARAIFMPQSLAKIALDLSRFHGREVKIAEVLRTVNSSCQADGFHLADSVCHVAIVAVDTSVVNAEQRLKIREKTKRIYKKHGKDFDVNQFEIFARHSKLAGRDESSIVEEFSELKLATPANSKAENMSTKNTDLAKTIDKIFKRPNDHSSIEIQATNVNDLALQLKTAQESIENNSLEITLNNSQSLTKPLKIENIDYSGLKTSLLSVEHAPKTNNDASVAERKQQTLQTNRVPAVQPKKVKNIKPASKDDQTAITFKQQFCKVDKVDNTVDEDPLLNYDCNPFWDDHEVATLDDIPFWDGHEVDTLDDITFWDGHEVDTLDDIPFWDDHEADTFHDDDSSPFRDDDTSDNDLYWL